MAVVLCRPWWLGPHILAPGLRLATIRVYSGTAPGTLCVELHKCGSHYCTIFCDRPVAMPGSSEMATRQRVGLFFQTVVGLYLATL